LSKNIFTHKLNFLPFTQLTSSYSLIGEDLQSCWDTNQKF
jgi:hypothetical protein